MFNGKFNDLLLVTEQRAEVNNRDEHIDAFFCLQFEKFHSNQGSEASSSQRFEAVSSWSARRVTSVLFKANRLPTHLSRPKELRHAMSSEPPR